MKNFMKMMTLALALLLTAPAIFAQADWVKNMDADISANNTLRYLRSLELLSDDLYATGDDLSAGYEQLEIISSNEGYIKFDSLKKTFEEEMKKNPFQASIYTYKKFYWNHEKDPIILPTIAMWVNKSFGGILPFRHQKKGAFWNDPALVGKMYNTMAEIDADKTLRNFKAYVKLGFESAYDTFPEEEKNETFIHTFFEKFKGQGPLAANASAELEEFVNELYQTKVSAKKASGQKTKEEIDAEVRRAFGLK